MRTVFALILLCLGWAQAIAATLTATPATIQSQLPHLRPGDTLRLLPGNYGVIQRVGSGTASNPVRVVGGPGVVVGGIKLTQTRYVSFEGLDLDGRLSGANEGVWLGQGTSQIRVASSRIHHFQQQGVLIPDYAGGGNQFIGLEVFQNGSRPHYQHGFYIQTADNVVADSYIHHNAGYGVHVYTGRGNTADRNVVRNNRIEHNGTMGDTTYGILLQDGERNAAIGNRLGNNNTGDIQVGNRTSGTILQGNQTSGSLLIRAPTTSQAPAASEDMPGLAQPQLPDLTLPTMLAQPPEPQARVSVSSKSKVPG